MHVFTKAFHNLKKDYQNVSYLLKANKKKIKKNKGITIF